MKVAITALCGAAALLVGTAVYGGTVSYDASVASPPGWINGTGNPNGGFTIVNDNGIELGLRAKYRHNPAVIDSPNNTYSVVPGPETNTTSGGNGSSSRAAWNYEFSINLNPTNSSPFMNLSQITANLTITDPLGNTASVDPLTYWSDDTGYGPFGAHTGLFPASQWLAQNSQNPAFADFPLFASYDMNRPGTYTFTLDVSSKASGSLLASDTINVEVVPLPKAAWGGAAMLCGLGLVGGVKRLRRETVAC